MTERGRQERWGRCSSCGEWYLMPVDPGDIWCPGDCGRRLEWFIPQARVASLEDELKRAREGER